MAWVVLAPLFRYRIEEYAKQDEDWTEEEKLNQGFREDEFAFLSDMIGPKGMAFDNDDVLEDSDDEDLKNDAVSQMDMQVNVTIPYSYWTIIDPFR